MTAFTDDQKTAAIKTINALVNADVEYACTHVDAGAGYAHLPAEIFKRDGYFDLARELQKHCVDCMGLNIVDVIADLALENFTMESGLIYYPSGKIVLMGYPVGEIESQIDYEGNGLSRELVEAVASDCDTYIGSYSYDSCLAYTGTDSVWYAVIDPGTLQTLIKQAVAERESDHASA